jgi:hypothetical protein
MEEPNYIISTPLDATKICTRPKAALLAGEGSRIDYHEGTKGTKIRMN